MDSPWRGEEVYISEDDSSEEVEKSAGFSTDDDSSSHGQFVQVSGAKDIDSKTKNTSIPDHSGIDSNRHSNNKNDNDETTLSNPVLHKKSSIHHSKQLQDQDERSILISDEECGKSNEHASKTASAKGNIHPLNTSKERQTELLNAKKYYEMELQRENAQLQSLKATIKTVKLENLPDKGIKLRSSIEKQVQKVQELNEQLNHVSANINELPKVGSASSSKVTKSDLKIPSIVDLTKDTTDLSEMGKRALATHQAHQSQTVKTLERLHKFLRSSTGEEKAEDPEGLKVPLLPHQKTALHWLLSREKEVPAGGILSDDMGLGKTLTMVSLLLQEKMNSSLQKVHSSDDEDEDDIGALPYKKYPHGGTLVVCPSSVMGQWSSEISSKVKGARLSVCSHHGPKRESRPHRLTSYDVVLTTYTILLHENKGDKTGPLFNIQWKRVILDEAHTIRNYKSQSAQAVFALRAKKRWALTGTPVHNKLDDYFALLKFLRCRPFDDIVIWKKMVGNRSDAGMQRLHLITKSLLLRRTKDEIQKSGGLQGLKPKAFSTIEVTLDPEEMEVYSRILHFSMTLLAQYIQEKAEKEDLLKDGLNIKRKGLSNPFNEHPELGKLYNNMLTLKGGVKTHHILVLLLRLRQICCHPSLVTSLIDQQELGVPVEDDGGNDIGLLEQMMNLSIAPDPETAGMSRQALSSDDPVFKSNRCSSKMRAAIDCLSEIVQSEQDKVVVVSQWTSVLNILDDFLRKMGIRTVSLNGSVPVKDRMGIINDFNNNPRGSKVLLLSLTAGGTGLNLVGANHLLMFDIHWNPQLEAQACDRIYRVGQEKVVHIYKFLCKDTIEERILKLQKQKLELAEGVLSGSGKVVNSKLSLQDLKLLFGIS